MGPIGRGRFFYTFWRNPLDQGMALSAYGHLLLRDKLKISAHSLQTEKFTSKMIKGLYEKLEGPFFKRGDKLIVYHDKDFVTLQLFGDKVGAYLGRDE